MPDTADAYIHRIGRTGRAQRTGDVFTLVTDEDKDMIRQLERIMGHPLKRELIEGFDYTPPRGLPLTDAMVAEVRPPRPRPPRRISSNT